ncbi:MAG: cyclic lactone autoinducer peptide [Anaerocolumna aminovalerica]|jgi:AgrD protein|nr:cyclic lactone autoinducer peptide [Anaerocolumna aminovalerica]MDU6266724.1 cyclic lactone autoinducer peptide [Anaerocolumna aminovalerica]
MKQIFFKFGTALASLTLVVTSLNVNTTCMLFVHQPKTAVEAKKLRYF